MKKSAPEDLDEMQLDDCFIIMPIADPDGYTSGHFKHVYDDIIVPACQFANVKALRADDVKATNLIHLDILKKLIEAPIAICDLSNRNPNVLFELGIRQAFDKPVVLIQEANTPKIFDIAPLRYLEYSREMKYHDVLRTQQELKLAIEETRAADGDSGSVNSIVKLLALSKPASVPDLKDRKDEFAFEVLHSELQNLKKMVESYFRRPSSPMTRSTIRPDLDAINDELEMLLKVSISPEKLLKFMKIGKHLEALMELASSEEESIQARKTLSYVKKSMQEMEKNFPEGLRGLNLN